MTSDPITGPPVERVVRQPSFQEGELRASAQRIPPHCRPAMLKSRRATPLGDPQILWLNCCRAAGPPTVLALPVLALRHAAPHVAECEPCAAPVVAECEPCVLPDGAPSRLSELQLLIPSAPWSARQKPTLQLLNPERKTPFDARSFPVPFFHSCSISRILFNLPNFRWLYLSRGCLGSSLDFWHRMISNEALGNAGPA